VEGSHCWREGGKRSSGNPVVKLLEGDELDVLTIVFVAILLEDTLASWRIWFLFFLFCIFVDARISYIHDFFQTVSLCILEFGFVLLPSKKTTIAPENGWLEDEFPFLLTDHIFRCYLMLVSGSASFIDPWNSPTDSRGFKHWGRVGKNWKRRHERCCWWKKSCTSWNMVEYPINCKVLYIQKVVVWDFFQPYGIFWTCYHKNQLNL